MSGGRIPIGVVGTGYLGRLHARILSEIPEADLVGFVELDTVVAREVETSLELRRFPTVEALAREVEAAVVATPTREHASVTRTLLDLGCDVLVEKPITSTPSEARDLIVLARRMGRIIQVGHVERYNPAVVAAAPFITTPRYIEAERLGVFAPRSLDIDVLLDLMIHDLNLVLSFVHSEVVEVRAAGVPVLTDKVDIANVRLEFENGVIANLTASRVSNERVRKIRLFGSDSYLSIDTKLQEVKGYQLQGTFPSRSISPLDVTVEKKEPLRAELEAFLSAVELRAEPLVTGEDGLAALELAIRVGSAIDESMARWQPGAV